MPKCGLSCSLTVTPQNIPHQSPKYPSALTPPITLQINSFPPSLLQTVTPSNLRRHFSQFPAVTSPFTPLRFSVTLYFPLQSSKPLPLTPQNIHLSPLYFSPVTPYTEQRLTDKLNFKLGQRADSDSFNKVFISVGVAVSKARLNQAHLLGGGGGCRAYVGQRDAVDQIQNILDLLVRDLNMQQRELA